MQLGKLIVERSARSWFRLDQLLDSVLADVVAADANFQLTQAQAWRDFGDSLAELGRIPTVDRVDFSLGFGRLEYLGLSELAVSLPLEVYRPGRLRRAWWGFVRLLGGSVPAKDQRYRLAGPKSAHVIELNVKARRNEQGRWTVDPVPAE